MRPYPKIRFIMGESRKLVIGLEPNDWSDPEIAAAQVAYEVEKANILELFQNKLFDDRAKNALEIIFYDLWNRLIQLGIMHETDRGWKIEHDHINRPRCKTCNALRCWGHGEFVEMVF